MRGRVASVGLSGIAVCCECAMAEGEQGTEVKRALLTGITGQVRGIS